MIEESPLPSSCAVAFKEWAGVCDALEAGSQSLLLRKGGIAEGPGGFEPEHRVFWLYPTHVHEAQQGLRTTARPQAGPPPVAGTVPIQALAVVETVSFVDRLEMLEALADLHVWTPETVEKRFQYRKPGVWVLGVRVFHCSAPIALPVTPEHAGCKTWVPLDPPLETAGLVPVLAPDEAARRLESLRTLLKLDR